MAFYIPIPSHSHMVNSHSFPFPFPILSPITIPMGFPVGYFHSFPFQFTNNRSIVVQHKQFWRIKDSADIQYHITELVTESVRWFQSLFQSLLLYDVCVPICVMYIAVYYHYIINCALLLHKVVIRLSVNRLPVKLPVTGFNFSFPLLTQDMMEHSFAAAITVSNTVGHWTSC